MRRIALLAAAIALLAAACGGGDQADPTTTPSTATTAAGEASGDTVADPGDSVVVHYRGTLDDGTEFDSSIGGDPLSFVVGDGRLIDGFDAAVRGMAVGETKTIRLEPDEAYGAYDPEMVLEVGIGDLPEGAVVGDQLMSDQGVVVTVKEINGETVVLDLNPELAGQALTFEITLVSVGG